MVQPALQRMTAAEFLDWNPGDDRRYELIGGVPLAMSPPSPAHALITNQVGRHLADALSADSPECRVLSGVGVRVSDDQVLISDVTVTCRPLAGQPFVTEPQVLIEVLSPSTEAHDRRTKLPLYLELPSVREILFLDSRSRFAEVHRRQDDGTWRIELSRFPGGRVELASLEIALSLEALYEGFEGEDPSASPRSS